MSRVIQCILMSIIFSFVYFTNLTEDSKNSDNCATPDTKNTKKHPLDVAKEYVEMYSVSNAAA